MDIYPRREGCDNLGVDYEHLIAALFSLRLALAKNVTEFWIASNAQYVGDFDDIVVLLKTTTDDRIAFLIQLKHVQSKKKIKAESFTYSQIDRTSQTEEIFSIEAIWKNNVHPYLKREKMNDAPIIKELKNVDKIIREHFKSEKIQLSESFSYSRVEPKKKGKESFSLEKYGKSNETFMANFFNLEDERIIQELRTAHKIIPILYTNTGVSKDIQFLQRSHLKVNYADLLNTFNTNDVNNCHRFNYKKLVDYNYNEDFLSKLHLFEDQVNAQDVLSLISKEMCNIFPSAVDFTNVVTQYMEYIKAWAKGYKVGKDTKFYTLTKPDVLKTLVGIVLLDTYKYDFTIEKFTFYADHPKTIWNEIISDKTVTLVNENKRVIEFIKSYYGTEVSKFIKLSKWSERLSESASRNFREQFKHSKIAHICQNTELTMALIYKILWMNGIVPLLLHIERRKYLNNQAKQIENILKILKVCQDSIKVIVLVPDSSKVKLRTKNSYFVTFHDLPPNQQDIILCVNVNFQYRLRLPLMNFVDKSMHSIIKCHDVIDILCMEFIIGTKVGEINAYFIDRCLSQVLLRYEVLTIPNEAFLIEAHDSQAAQEKLNKFIPKNSRIYFVSSNDVKKRLKSTKGTRHRLKYNEGYFEWVESVGDVRNVRDYQVESYQDKYELLQSDNLGEYLTSNRTKKTRIISDCPGMGKSTLMNFVAFSAPGDLWVLKIKLTDMVSVSKATIKKTDDHRKAKSKPVCSRSSNSSSSDSSSSDSESTSEDDYVSCKSFDVIKYFRSTVTNDEKTEGLEISLAVFQRFYQANKILILLDGFDEIAITHKEKATEIIKDLQDKQHQMWVTTRDHLKTHLEDTLGVLALTLKSFTHDEQKSFLIKYFKANIKTSDEVSKRTMLDKFADHLLIAAKNNLSDRDGQFTGIPLQTRMLAESFLKNCEKSCNSNEIELNEQFDLLKLYEKFVKQKNKILVNEKFGSNEKVVSKDIEEAQQYFALYTVFGEDTVKKFKMKEKLDWYYEDIKSQIVQREGILVVRESKTGIHIDFIHRTFAEYFVAKFLAQNFASEKDFVRRNVLLLIEERFSRPYEYEFLFWIFDRVLVKRHSIHLNIINLKIDKIMQKLEQNPNSFLEKDGFNRNGFHMLVLYGTEQKKDFFSRFRKKEAKIDLSTFDRYVDSIEVGDLKLTDRLGYNVFDYCVNFNNLRFAAALFRKAFYVPLRCRAAFRLNLHCEKDYFRDTNRDFVRAIFYNFLVRDLLRGRIYEETPIDVYCKIINKYSHISGITSQFINQPGVSITSDFIKQIGIKDSDTSKYSDIRFAVVLGSKTNVEDLLSSREIDVNERYNGMGETLLHYASYNRRAEIFELLIEHGADMNLNGRNRCTTALHILAETGQVDLLEKWLHKIEDLDIEDEGGDTALNCAIKCNQTDTAKILILKGARTKDMKKSEEVTNWESNSLYSILSRGHVEMATLLIEYNIDISLNLLHWIAKNGNRELFESTLQKGFDINRVNRKAQTPLTVAIKHGHEDLAEYIISRGADVGIGHRNVTALNEAVNIGNERLISLILEQSSSRDIPFKVIKMQPRARRGEERTRAKLVARRRGINCYLKLKNMYDQEKNNLSDR